MDTHVMIHALDINYCLWVTKYMFDNEMNDCKTKPNASLQLSMNAAMEAICVM